MAIQLSCPNCGLSLSVDLNTVEVACKGCKSTSRVIQDGNSVSLELGNASQPPGIIGEIKRIEGQIEDVIDTYDGPILTFAVIAVICAVFAATNPPGSVHSSFGLFCLMISVVTGYRVFTEWKKRKKKIEPLRDRLKSLQ